MYPKLGIPVCASTMEIVSLEYEQAITVTLGKTDLNSLTVMIKTN